MTLIDCGHPSGCRCELTTLERVPCGYDTAALCAAAIHVRDGRWFTGAPTHVFAELLRVLAKDGFVLARQPAEEEADRAMITPLPLLVGLCPVHAGESYAPVDPADPDPKCPACGCRLLVYAPRVDRRDRGAIER